MEEFFTQVDKLKALIDKASAIADGSGVDNLDLSQLKNEAEAIANSCFAGGKMTPAQSVSRKDAYDFVVACSRLSDVISMTRADYYTKAVTDLVATKERVEFTKIAVINMESAGRA